MNIPYHIITESYIHSDRDLGDFAKLVYGAIVSARGNNDYVIDIAVLSEFYGRDEKDIQKAIHQLISAGHLPEYVLCEENVQEDTQLSEGDMIYVTNFRRWVDENAPRINKMRDPLTDHQILKLKADYSRGELQAHIKGMHNWTKLLDKRVSAYMTLRDWINRERKKNPVRKQIDLSVLNG